MAALAIENASAADIISLLQLSPHPEGGFFRETFRDSASAGAGRATSTSIYFLLPAGETSHWHRVDAAEIWHFYAGAPLVIRLSQTGQSAERQVLGPGLFEGERPQIVVPAHCWQSATSLGEWTLVGCTVAPGFEFAHFEIAPKEWEPGV